MSENRGAKRPGRLKNTMAHPLPVWLAALIAACAIAFGYVIQPYFGPVSGTTLPQGEQASGANAPIRISEVMTSNKSAVFTTDSVSADYVEVVNTGSYTLNLKGLKLTVTDNATKTYVFPDRDLAPGQVAVVFCGKNLSASSGTEMRAPFSLSASGCTVVLSAEDDTVIQTLEVPQMESNRVYHLNEKGEYAVSASYTPGYANTDANHKMLRSERVDSPFEITEIMPAAQTYGADFGACDYIEIHNTSSSRQSLEGWGLSDDRDNPHRWTFPAGTGIDGGGYLTVYCAGSGVESSSLTADFMLSSRGETAVLSDPYGRIACEVKFPALGKDQAYTLVGGHWTTNMAPTPGYGNTIESVARIDAEYRAKNSTGVTINEVMASTDSAKYDWVELYNSSAVPVDLSGFGLSDKTSAPLKWTFPSGTYIGAGEYMTVSMSGQGGSGLNASFRLSVDGGYTLCLSDASGNIFDRIYVPEQYHNISYGRQSAQSGFFFFTSPTPQMVNSTQGFTQRAQKPVYSAEGGLYHTGDVITVSMSAPSDCRIYYTLDYSEPSESHGTYYTGPITITQTSVLRTRVYSSSAMESYVDTQTYLFDADHTVNVVCLSADYNDLFDEDTGIYTNYKLSKEIKGYLEYYDHTTGEALLSQGCGIKLHGDFSRKEKQKAFKVYARSELGGGGKFAYPLFSGRDYTEYSSFLLRSSGQDTMKTRMRDSVLTSLARGSSVFYQETEICVLYLDGHYWGQYYLREHIRTYSICQFEGWQGQEKEIDLIKANSTVFQGSNNSMADLLKWVNSHNMDTDEAYRMLDQNIDIQNYIEYMSVEIYTGNTDTLNVKRYRNTSADGKWKWVLYDLDWAFTVDTNSIARWIAKGGMGNEKRTNNDLFIACMKNSTFRDRFLTYFGEKLATTYSTENMHALFQQRYQELLPELPRQFEKWGETQSTYNKELKFIMDYASSRPAKLLDWTRKALSLSNSQMQKYFGDAMAKAGWSL